MRFLALLIAFIVGGCTVLAKDEYMAVSDPVGYKHDKLEKLDCYETEGLEVCSHPFDSKSLMIGVIVPIWPQFTRGRLSYDIDRERSVRIRNTSEGAAQLVLVASGNSCEDAEAPKTCEELKGFELMPAEEVWMKLPEHSGLELRVYFDGSGSIIKLRTKSRLNIHAVAV
ncbi:hypothetical protein D4A39_00950 [Alcanivorax profundi]|uniref:Lipoprotein n=2 Tax=Alcanivorax profundi TaxID=2338368 RepID=A0A418Y1P8_9GAMM|nr:hypothetical protein D4A39_00950 [Alcanivorax profundi]